MPLVTLTLKKGRPAAERDTILDGVHGALVRSGVPEADRFQRVLELDADHFRYDAKYPDVGRLRARIPTD